MPKVGSAHILFDQDVSYGLPEKINVLEIEGESLFDYESPKRRIKEDVKQCCVDISSKGFVTNYNSENSDSLGSSPESSSDPDSSPPVELPEFSNDDFWKRFSSCENGLERKERNCENFSVVGHQSTKEIENSRKNLIFPFDIKETMVHSSQSEKSMGLKNCVLPSEVSIGENLRNLGFVNKQLDSENIFLSADKKHSEYEKGEDFLDSILTSVSSTVDKDPYLYHVLTSNCKSNIPDEQCNLPGVIKHYSEEVTILSDSVNNTCLKDKNDEKMFSTPLSDIDSFLNSVSCIEMSDSNQEMKQKKSEKISLVAPIFEKSSSDNGVGLSNLLDDICLKDVNEGICSSFPHFTSEIDSFLNSMNLIESDEPSDFYSEKKLKHKENSIGMINCDENISLSALAEQHLQSNAFSGALHTTENIKNSSDRLNCQNENITLADLAEQHLKFNTPSLHSTVKCKNNEEYTVESKDTYSSGNKNCKENAMCDLLSDLRPDRLNKENIDVESGKATLQVIDDKDNGDHFGSLDIDLTSCLKSLRPATPLNDSADVESVDENPPDSRSSASPFRFSSPLLTHKFYDPPSKVRNVNVNQSLFAKALSCKPRKDSSAMVKVLKLQSDVCNLFFGPSQVSPTAKPKKEIAVESNQSVIGSIGRRIFGKIPQCEVS